MSDTTPSLGVRLMPALFVLLWSTGFIGAKFGLPYAEPFTLLGWRMLATLVLLIGLARLLNAAWPGPRTCAHLAVAGLLVHGCYLGGVFYAIEWGMPAGLASLIVGLQPLLTALMAVLWLRERLRWVQWLGLVMGLVGVALVLGNQLSADPQALFEGFSPGALGWVVAALVGISLGTVYQKRFCSQASLVPGTAVQYGAATLFFGVGALLMESGEMRWELPLLLSFLWLIFGLSIGAILLLMRLIRQGAASKVASLFYLVPPVTALEAYLLFGERMEGPALVGGAVAVTGVALVILGGRPRAAIDRASETRAGQEPSRGS